MLNKYELYERSVQTPEVHVEWYSNMYQDAYGKPAKDLREDFCGTFQMSCEWVKRHPENTALGIDLDTEPLSYGKKTHLSKLTPSQKKRVMLLPANVLVPTSPKRDLIIVGNFSFFIFKERSTLLEYFRSCLKSLRPKGAIILEMAGGPGMIATGKEQKTLKIGRKKKFTYIWEQKSFDPVHHDAEYAIHFKFPDGKKMLDAFTYDWRLWTIPEVRDLFIEAGFSKTRIYWETEHRGRGTGEYVPMEKGDNAFAWIAYVVAIP